MLAYNLRIAWRSLRRTPVLSVLLVVGIAVGIAVSTAFVAAYHYVSRNPIPAKQHQLHYVELDSWNPERAFDDEHPEKPPNQLTYRDAMALVDGNRVAPRQTAMYKTELTVFPAGQGERPFRARTRVTFRDFFAMFDAPFRYGGAWSAEADAGPQAVVVLDDETNRKLFGGGDSVGRTVRMEDRDFTVVGVLAPWYPKPKYFDPHNDPYEQAEEAYIPFRWTAPMRLESSGNTSGWKPWNDAVYEEKLESEAVWIQFWAELPDARSKEAYQAFLDGYAGEQKKLGRFGRPLNNRLLDVQQWLDDIEVVPASARSMLVISLLFLVVCSVNLIGILLGKFLARSPEVGVRRALGASRGAVFLQHLLECELVGILGGLAGVALSAGVLHAIARLVHVGDGPPIFQMEWPMVGAGMVLALLAGLIAGVYPAWRICRIAPALHLKQQ